MLRRFFWLGPLSKAGTAYPAGARDYKEEEIQMEGSVLHRDVSMHVLSLQSRVCCMKVCLIREARVPMTTEQGVLAERWRVYDRSNLTPCWVYRAPARAAFGSKGEPGSTPLGSPLYW